MPRDAETDSPRSDGEREAPPGWRALTRGAQVYVGIVIAAGAAALVAFFPLHYPRPLLFAFLLVSACVISVWKVTLPISPASGSTLSVSYAAHLMTLLLLGPQHAMVVAAAGAWTQCTVKAKRNYPIHRTVFSIAAEAITIVVTGLVYAALGGGTGPFDVASLTRPLVGAITTYFFVNTGLVAGAIAFANQRPFLQVWRHDFMWSGASFMVAGSAGALAAVVFDRGQHWTAVLLLAPIYLTYRSYELFVARLDDQKRHVAESRRLQRETARALQEAERANRLKDQFLATVSHELRTPLNAILGWADLLRSGKLDESRSKRACEAIYRSAQRQAQLVDELLDVARIMSGKLRLERTRVDIESIVRGAVDVVQPLADAKQVRLLFEAAGSIGAVDGDGARLQQIAWNLLSNAVKFTPEGGLVRARLHRTNDSIELQVSDSGEGIAAEFLPWVFEPFRQADASTTRPHGGLGLGLSIVKHLVESHGGTVTAESGGEGRGATFTVRLPAASDLVPDRTLPPELPDQAASLEGISVLVVDDDEDSREVVAAHLRARHAVILTAASAEQAFDLLQREHVDVLLADVAMPREDGYTLVRRLRALNAARTASIPAVALSAFAREEDRQQAAHAGFQLHLAKPVDGRALVMAVASFAKVNPA